GRSSQGPTPATDESGRAPRQREPESRGDARPLPGTRKANPRLPGVRFRVCARDSVPLDVRRCKPAPIEQPIPGWRGSPLEPSPGLLKPTARLRQEVVAQSEVAATWRGVRLAEEEVTAEWMATPERDPVREGTHLGCPPDYPRFG